MEANAPLIRDISEVEFEESKPAWYAKPIKRKVLWKDPNTGALHLIIRYPQGLGAPEHRHNCAHTMFILDGHMVINGKTCGRGTYAHFPANKPMVHTTPDDDDCTFLLFFEKSPEFTIEGGKTYKIG